MLALTERDNVKSFSEYSKPLNKKFVGLFLERESEEALRRWVIKSGFDITKDYSGKEIAPEDFDFHSTIFYTTSEHNTTNGSFEIEPFELTFSKFELLGKQNNVPVLKLDTDNEKLIKIRKRFEMMGYKDEWPEFKPHISLSYSYNGTPALDTLELPDIMILANRIRIEDQDS